MSLPKTLLVHESVEVAVARQRPGDVELDEVVALPEAGVPPERSRRHHVGGNGGPHGTGKNSGMNSDLARPRVHSILAAHGFPGMQDASLPEVRFLIPAYDDSRFASRMGLTHCSA